MSQGPVLIDQVQIEPGSSGTRLINRASDGSLQFTDPSFPSGIKLSQLGGGGGPGLGSTVLTVGVTGAQYTTIGAAVAAVLAASPPSSIDNPYTILISSGVYSENVSIIGIDGLTLVGLGNVYISGNSGGTGNTITFTSSAGDVVVPIYFAMQNLYIENSSGQGLVIDATTNGWNSSFGEEGIFIQDCTFNTPSQAAIVVNGAIHPVVFTGGIVQQASVINIIESNVVFDSVQNLCNLDLTFSGTYQSHGFSGSVAFWNCQVPFNGGPSTVNLDVTSAGEYTPTLQFMSCGEFSIETNGSVSGTSADIIAYGSQFGTIDLYYTGMTVTGCTYTTPTFGPSGTFQDNTPSTGGPSGPTGPTGPIGQTGPAGAGEYDRWKTAQLGSNWFSNFNLTPISYPVASGASFSVFDGTNIWIWNGTIATVLNAQTGQPVHFSGLSIVAGGGAAQFGCFDGTNIWIPDFANNSISKINATTGVVTTGLTIGATLNQPIGVCYDGEYLWISQWGGSGTVVKSSVSGAFQSQVSLGAIPQGPSAFDGTNLWVTTRNNVVVFDVHTGTPTSFSPLTLGGSPFALAFDGTSMWTTDTSSQEIYQVNALTGVITNTYSGFGTQPYAVTFDGTNIWALDANNNRIFVFNVASATLVATYIIVNSSNSFGITFDGSNIWALNPGNNSASRISPPQPPQAQPLNTLVTTSYTQPFGGDNVTVAVVTTQWMIPGQSVYISNVGYYFVDSITNGTHVVLENSSWTGNLTGGSSVTAPQTLYLMPGPSTSLNGLALNPERVAIKRWYNTNQIGFTYSVGVEPYYVAFDGLYLWVACFSSSAVYKVSPFTGVVGSPISTGVHPIGVTYDGVHIWVANNGTSAPGTMTTLNANDGSAAFGGTINVGNNPWASTFDGTYIWVTNTSSNSVSVLLASTGVEQSGAPFNSPITVGNGPKGIAFDGTNIWIGNVTDSTLTVLNATTASPTSFSPVSTNGGVYDIAFDGTHIWTNSENGTIQSFDINTGNSAFDDITLGNTGYGLCFDGSSMWATNQNGSEGVVQIDINTGTVIGKYTGVNNPVGIAFDGANLWVANNGSGMLTKV